MITLLPHGFSLSQMENHHPATSPLESGKRSPFKDQTCIIYLEFQFVFCLTSLLPLLYYYIAIKTRKNGLMLPLNLIVGYWWRCGTQKNIIDRDYRLPGRN